MEDRGRRVSAGDLTVLPYHHDVADWLEQHESAGWAAVAAAEPPTGDPAGLLRSAYRLAPVAHPAVHAAVARASENLGVKEPVVVYQAEGGLGANAALLHLPDELAVVLSGNLLGLLPEEGLTAVLGHELAHHLLMTADGGRYAIAGRLLDLLSVDAGTPLPYLETARRYQLATELFADRGAVVAAGDLYVAVAALVATVTGLADIDAAAYLAQAEQADPANGTRADSHPETVLRAWSLGRWYAGLDHPESDSTDSGPGEFGPGELAVRALLRPRLDLDTLDLFDRADLERVTRALIDDLLTDPRWHSEAQLALVHQYFPDAGPLDGGEAWGSPAASIRAVPEGAAPATRRYLAYVLLDLVTADPDVDVEQSVAAALRFATAAGLGPDLEKVAHAELGLSAAAWRRIGAPPAAEPAAAPAEPAPAPVEQAEQVGG